MGKSYRIEHLKLAGLLALVGALALHQGEPHRELRFQQLTSPYAFDLLGWEVNHLWESKGSILQGLLGRDTSGSWRPKPEQIALVRRYVAESQSGAAGAASTARGSASEETEGARPGGDGHRIGEQASQVRGILEGQVSSYLWSQGLATRLGPGALLDWLFPPVSFTFSQPPKAVVVSPRDTIRVAYSSLLEPSMSLLDMESLEAQIDSLGYSSLVVQTGGIGTYPSLIPEDASLERLLSSVAHEWLHAYFFFRPLGRGYWSDYEARTINETAADLAGREIGKALAEAYGMAEPARGPDQEIREAEAFDFRQEMRRIRQRVDALLAEGRVSEAEAFMAERRDYLELHGYRIRKLNQAYFAFHGSYAEGPASVSPVAAQLQELRRMSASVGEFILRVSQVANAGELTLLLEPRRGAGS